MDLLERLREATSARQCAGRCLEWLGAHAGLDRGLYLRVDEERRELLGVAGHGLPPEAVEFTRIDLRGHDTPLPWVLSGTEIVEFDARDMQAWLPAVPFGEARFAAAPVSLSHASPAIGLLLVSAAESEVLDTDAVAWAASLLGMRLAQLLHGEMPGQSERLKRERSWLLGIIETVTDPILLTDSDGRILIANRSAEDLFVADESASEGRRHAVALNNMLFSASLGPLSQLEDSGHHELLLVDPVEGSDLLLELISKPLQIGAGENGTVAILRNVTDLHRAFQELEENYKRLHAAEGDARGERDRLDLVLNSVVDPILVTNAQGEVVMMNPPAAHVLTVGEASSPEAERRVQANDAVLSSFLSNVYTRSREPWRSELKLTDPESGAELPIEAIGTTYTDASGESAVVTILHDRSEAVEKARLYEQIVSHSTELEEKVREATAELAEQNELLRRQALELERASAMKSQFLANVSHELRTPLNAMLGYTSLLLESVYGELQPLQHEKLTRVAANAQHLTTIIDDVLDITRIEAGKIPVVAEEFDLAALVQAVLAEFEPLIADSGLDIEIDVPQELPLVYSDAGKVKQIVINLFSNALKFTPSGAVSVVARHRVGEDLIAVEIVDTGAGIVAEKQDVIFDAFGQSDDLMAVSKGGSGLGLSICKRLAGVLGGSIELESALGQGSTFRLIIPRRLREE